METKVRGQRLWPCGGLSRALGTQDSLVLRSTWFILGVAIWRESKLPIRVHGQEAQDAFFLLSIRLETALASDSDIDSVPQNAKSWQFVDAPIPGKYRRPRKCVIIIYK